MIFPSVPSRTLGQEEISFFILISTTSQKSKNKIDNLYARKFYIFISDLSKIKKRLDQEKYWSKNPDRNGLIQYSFDDLFVEKDWVMWGQRRGKNGKRIS